MPHALITGGAGFIGSHLAERLARPWPLRALVAFASVAVTLASWALLPPRFFITEPSDFVGFYGPVAESLLAGRGLTADGVTPALRYPPGFPLMLAGVYWIADRAPLLERESGVRAMNLAASALAALFVYELARAASSAVAALLPAALWMTYPLMLALSKGPTTELPFAALLYAGLLFALPPLWDRKPELARALAAGLLLGCAMLVRPVALGLPAVLALLALARLRGTQRGARYAGALFVGAFLVIAPWEAWILARTGRLILLSTGAVPSIRDGLTFAVHPARSYRVARSLPADVRAVQLAFLERYRELQDVPAVARALAEQAAARPIALGKLLAWKAARAWYGTDSGKHEGTLLLVQGFYLALIAVGVTMAWRHPSVRFHVLSLLLILGYFWLMATVVLSIARYIAPAMGAGFAAVVLGGKTPPRLSGPLRG